MIYKGKPITFKRVIKKIRKKIKYFSLLDRKINNVTNNVKTLHLKFNIKQTLSDKLTVQEIDKVLRHGQSLSHSSPKLAKQFYKNILSFAKGNPLSIEMMDARLPDIFGRFASSDLERSVMLLDSIDKYSKAEIKTYCDARIHSKIKERSSSFRSRTKNFSTSLAAEAFMDIKRLLDEHNITFFLVRGTLLGAIRNGGFMENDYDIDLGFFEHDITSQKLESIVAKSKHFKLFESNDRFGFGISHINKVEINLFAHFLDSSALCHRSKIHKWYNTPFVLENIDFIGIKVNIPQNYDLYLSENYGNWRDKISFYDFSYDTPNVKYANNIESLEYFSSRISNAAKNKWFRSYACSNRALKQVFNIDFGRYYPRPADGDIMDNLEKRKQLLIVHDNALDSIDALLEKLIDYCEGSNIMLDMILVGTKSLETSWLELFEFIDKTNHISDCIRLDPKELYVYDAIITEDNFECPLLLNYPLVKIQLNNASE